MRTSRCTPASADEQPVGVVAGHRERRALDAGLVARLQVDDLAPEAAALRPAQVHAQQHLGPVLRLGAAGARMDRDDRVLAIELARQHRPDLGGLHVARVGVERRARDRPRRPRPAAPSRAARRDRRSASGATRRACGRLRAGGGAAGSSARSPGPSRNPAPRPASRGRSVPRVRRASSKSPPQVGGAVGRARRRARICSSRVMVSCQSSLATPATQSRQHERRRLTASDSQATTSPM